MSTYSIRLSAKQEMLLRQLAERRKEKRARTLKWLIEEAARIFLDRKETEEGSDASSNPVEF